MLRFLSERRKSQKLIWIMLSGVVVFGMVAFYSPASRYSRFGNGTTVISEQDTVATVAKHNITVADYVRGLDSMMQLYRNFLSQRGGEVDYATLQGMGLDKTVLDNLIRKKIVDMEVDRLKLHATEDELKSRIREQFSPGGKWIGYEKYRRSVERTGQTVEEFETSLRQQIAEDKLRTFISSSAQVSVQEVQEQFNRENTAFNLAYAVVDPVALQDKVTFTEADLQSFFNTRKAEFRIDKPSRKVEYLFINQEQVGKILDVSEEELKKDYNPEKFVASLRISQIMLKILTPSDAASVEQKAAELANRARGIAGTQPEDFGALARGNSQDPATKDKEGDLGVIKKEAIKPESYLQRALNMKVGEVSDPIRDNDRIYVLKLTERTNKTFEEVKESLLASARNRLSYKKASDLADEAYRLLVEKKDTKVAAAELAPKLNAKAEDLVRQTPLFANGDDVPDIGTNPTFEEATANLKKAGDVGVKVGIRGGFAVPRLLEKSEPHDATFEEVKLKVEQRYKQDKAKDFAAERAKNLLANLSNLDSLKAAAEKESFKFATKEDFKEGQTLENFGVANAVMPLALKMKEGELAKEPVFANEKYLIFGLTKRQDPDLTKYNEQAKSIEQRLLEERRQLVFDSYVNNIKKRLRQEKVIVIYKNVINQVFAKPTAES
jgi:peptidyl-prolyl cis-trans isomerase D